MVHLNAGAGEMVEADAYKVTHEERERAMATLMNLLPLVSQTANCTRGAHPREVPRVLQRGLFQ